MTSDALINGKVVELTPEEKAAAEAFHNKRLPFAFLNGELLINRNPNDDRDHQHWLCEDCGITVEEFEKLPRGYMLGSRIQLFKGSTFEPVKIPEELPERLLNAVINIFFMTNPLLTVASVFNGVKIGKVGEIWPPMEKVGDWTNLSEDGSPKKL